MRFKVSIPVEGPIIRIIVFGVPLFRGSTMYWLVEQTRAATAAGGKICVALELQA